MSLPVRSHTQELLAKLSDPKDIDRFLSAIAVLRPRLVHTREIPNGLDFLFEGPEEEIHGALRSLTEIEPRGGCPIQLNYVRIETYFLLRVLGSQECQDLIRSYFDSDPPPGKAPSAD
jgi:hypothetical protein